MAMEAVIKAEIALGREPRDVSAQRGLGYDLESKDLSTGHLYFIEVKGRWHLKDEVVLTKNEILCARNEPDRFRLAVVVIDENGPRNPKYLVQYRFGEPDFAETMRSFSLNKLLQDSVDPM